MSIVSSMAQVSSCCADNHFACQVFLVNDLRVIFDMCGGGDFAAQLHNGIRSAYRIQISATGEFFPTVSMSIFLPA